MEAYLHFDREEIYKNYKGYFDNLHKERYDNLILRDELEVPQEIRKKLEESVKLQKWVTVKSDGDYSTLPHQYVVYKKWNSNIISFNLFCEMIRYYGSVRIWKGTLENWEGRKGEYLKIGHFNYWTMGYSLDITSVLNRENPLYSKHDEYRNHQNEEI